MQKRNWPVHILIIAFFIRSTQMLFDNLLLDTFHTDYSRIIMVGMQKIKWSQTNEKLPQIPKQKHHNKKLCWEILDIVLLMLTHNHILHYMCKYIYFANTVATITHTIGFDSSNRFLGFLPWFTTRITVTFRSEKKNSACSSLSCA